MAELCQREKVQGRQVWVFAQNTDTWNVLDRSARILADNDLQAKALKSNTPLAKREAWIAKHGPKCDVVLSHPKLVETGLDLFSKAGGHNFCSLVFFQTGYNLFTLRQASRRAWRLGQTQSCKVFYLYYASTMQERAILLMAKKMVAARALEGEFSADGLLAMAGDGDSMELALAKSLVQRMGGKAALRQWGKVW